MPPARIARLLLYPISRLFYKIRSVNERNVPARGPALLVANHVSFIDAFLIAMATKRLVRFMMLRVYYDLPVIGWFFKAMKCIPVSSHDGPKAIVESFRSARAALQAGEAVCIFAEGEISRHGQMLRFKKGFERIIDGIDVPVVPVHLDEVWGSMFSFSGGRLFWKWPRRLPYPVTVSFGKPLEATCGAFALRQAILELGAEAFRLRLERSKGLGPAFLEECWRHPFRLALADSSGQRMTYAEFAVKAKLTGLALAEQSTGSDYVGVLLPPSAAAAVANVGLILAGKIPVNLNYTASSDLLDACRAKAGVQRVVTSRAFLERLGWPVHGAIFIEDIKPSLRDLLRRVARPPLNAVATVLFTSGSTGIPKGVTLTQYNVLSNLLAVAQVYEMSPRDRLLGILPFFHAFGFTATLWMPLLSGMGVVYHHNPLDAKKIGELVERFKCTFLMSTPTFLQALIKRLEPAQLASLRCVIVGAEKMNVEIATAFSDKFGLTPLEGYGCTELSPVAAVNIPDIDWPGVRQTGAKRGTVGHPLPGVFMKVVDPATGADLPAGIPGLLLVKGPNVMKGYLGDPERTAEVMRDGYYITGDIASIDADGFVTITDRLNRFSKIGGEMVPHICVEEKLQELCGRMERTFVVTSVPDAKRGERLIVLYKDYDDIDALYARLPGAGLPKLWLPERRAFHAVSEFPLLGTGKLDLSGLKAQACLLEEHGTH